MLAHVTCQPQHAPTKPCAPSQVAAASPPAAVDKVGDLQVSRHPVSQLLGILSDLVVQIDGGGVLQGVEGGRKSGVACC